MCASRTVCQPCFAKRCSALRSKSAQHDPACSSCGATSPSLAESSYLSRALLASAALMQMPAARPQKKRCSAHQITARVCSDWAFGSHRIHALRPNHLSFPRGVKAAAQPKARGAAVGSEGYGIQAASGLQVRISLLAGSQNLSSSSRIHGELSASQWVKPFSWRHAGAPCSRKNSPAPLCHCFLLRGEAGIEAAESAEAPVHS